MPDAVYYCTNTVFSAATGAKTALNVIAGANQNIAVKAWGVSFDGATGTATPATVELMQSTQAGAGTGAASPPAPVQLNGRTLSAQFTTAHNFTAEPTVLTRIAGGFIPQFMGFFEEQFEPGSEPSTDFSGGTVKAIAIRVNSSATVNVYAWMRVTCLAG
jgi:hypothetical protein